MAHRIPLTARWLQHSWSPFFFTCSLRNDTCRSSAARRMFAAEQVCRSDAFCECTGRGSPSSGHCNITAQSVSSILIGYNQFIFLLFVCTYTPINTVNMQLPTFHFVTETATSTSSPGNIQAIAYRGNSFRNCGICLKQLFL
jgi:hypothetical protein